MMLVTDLSHMPEVKIGVLLCMSIVKYNYICHEHLLAAHPGAR